MYLSDEEKEKYNNRYKLDTDEFLIRCLNEIDPKRNHFKLGKNGYNELGIMRIGNLVFSIRFERDGCAWFNGRLSKRNCKNLFKTKLGTILLKNELIGKLNEELNN